MDPRLCVPLIQLFVARKVNWASWRCSLTTLMVANRASVSTPLRAVESVMLIGGPFLVAVVTRRSGTGRNGGATFEGDGPGAHPDRSPGGGRPAPCAGVAQWPG